MATLASLKLDPKAQIASGETWDDLPEQLGGQWPDPPQPGSFRFRLPSSAALAECWADKALETERGERIQALLLGGAAVTIIQSPAGKYNGETFETRISNSERKRGKDADKLASDMDYLLNVCGVAKKPRTNTEYGAAFVSCGGKEFGGDIEWSWRCDPKRPARFRLGDAVMVADGKEGRPDQQGCGAKFYQKDVEKVENDQKEMAYPLRIECPGVDDASGCGAELRAFANISRFRK